VQKFTFYCDLTVERSVWSKHAPSCTSGQYQLGSTSLSSWMSLKCLEK